MLRLCGKSLIHSPTTASTEVPQCLSSVPPDLWHPPSPLPHARVCRLNGLEWRNPFSLKCAHWIRPFVFAFWDWFRFPIYFPSLYLLLSFFSAFFLHLHSFATSTWRAKRSTRRRISLCVKVTPSLHSEERRSSGEDAGQRTQHGKIQQHRLMTARKACSDGLVFKEHKQIKKKGGGEISVIIRVSSLFICLKKVINNVLGFFLLTEMIGSGHVHSFSPSPSSHHRIAVRFCQYLFRNQSPCSTQVMSLCVLLLNTY